jgi:hypothetical protein
LGNFIAHHRQSSAGVIPDVHTRGEPIIVEHAGLHLEQIVDAVRPADKTVSSAQAEFDGIENVMRRREGLGEDRSSRRIAGRHCRQLFFDVTRLCLSVEAA